MKRIEFMGPPGAGKTTIVKELIKDDSTYGGTLEDAIQRKFFEYNPSFRLRLAYNLSSATFPSFVDSEIVGPRLKRAAFEEYVLANPDILRVLKRVLEETDHESKKVYRMCRSAIERFQRSNSTVYDNELLCLDESFAQRAISIRLRSERPEKLVSDYIQVVAKPDLIVYIDAPSEICLERWINRSESPNQTRFMNNINPKVSQQKLHESCEQILSMYDSCTETLRINNQSNVQDTVTTIRKSVQHILS